MKRVLLIAALAVSSSSFASHIYEVPRGTLRTLSFDDGVIDAIPQLGVVITREALSDSRGLSDLGESQQIELIAPIVAPPKSLWGLQAIHLKEAWTITRGAGAVVAVSDTGIDSSHKEIAPQMWTNKKEAAGVPGVDDEGNGYIDDVHGWDFVKNKPGGVDHHFHGTHVAGTIAASVTKSMAGVAPLARVMDVSFLDSKGHGNNVNGAKSLVYAVDNGARVINCSWGGPGAGSPVLEKALKYAQDHGVIVIAAAGNNSKNNDKTPFAPSGLAYDNIVSVGATASASGSLADFSNYGEVSVDLAAPGDSIYSLAPGGGHQTLSGTSMATPHAAGVAALVISAHPTWTVAQVRATLLKVAPASGWKHRAVTGGQLDAARAVTP